MKIQSNNVWAYVNHLQVLAYLSGLPFESSRWELEKIHMELTKIEKRVHNRQTHSCNGTIDEDKCERLDAKDEAKVLKMLPKLESFFINSDPRGYSLKIKDKKANELREQGVNIYQDWGGYGILAPEF